MPRKVTVATTGWGLRFGADVRGNVERAYGLLDEAGAHGPDIAVLPETFPRFGIPMARAAETAQVAGGETFDGLAARARRHGMYVFAGVVEERGGRLFNAVWAFDRRGEFVGRYDKMHPTVGELDAGIVPGDAAGIVDTDCGRVGVAVCYDIGWPERWDELGAAGAGLVLWPSAYDGGFPLQAYAWRNGYHVVSSVWSEYARVINPVGQIVASTDRLNALAVAEIDLDTLVMHADANEQKIPALLARFGKGITVRTLAPERVIALVSNDPAWTTADIAREFGLVSYRDHYAHATECQAAHRTGEPAGAAR